MTVRKTAKAAQELAKVNGQRKVTLEDTLRAAPSRVLSARQYADMAPEKIDWVCEPWIATGTSTLFAGHAKAGKTTFLFKLLKGMEKGGDVLGHRVNSGKVLVWTENGPAAWRFKVDTFLGATSAHVSVIPYDAGILKARSFKDNAAVVFEEAQRNRCQLVVVDSLGVLAGIEDPNNPNEVNKALDAINRGCHEYEIAALLIHHLNKAGSSPAGSFMFQADPDVLMELHGEYDQPRTLKVKGRLFVTAPADLTFTLDAAGEYEVIDPAESDDALDILEVLPSKAAEALLVSEILNALKLDDNKRWSVGRALAALMKAGKVGTVPRFGKNKRKYATYYRVNLNVSVRRS